MTGSSDMTPDISTEEIVDALTETEGNQGMAAARLGCCRQLIWKRAKTEPAIRAAIRQGTKRRIRVAADIPPATPPTITTRI